MKIKILKRASAVMLCLTLAVSALCFAPSVSAAQVYDGEHLDVPQIRVVTENGNGTTLQKEDDYVNAQITIKDTDGTELSDAVQFKVRGNTTALSWVTKKAFTFKFAKKKNVLGMGSGKKWFLLANAFDPTLLRNYTAFELARELGLEYTSNQKICELWVDGSFRGCYTLYEPVQEGKDRVNIDIESNGGKKDFLLEFEAVTEEDDKTYLVADKRFRFAFKDPEEPTEEQQAYVQEIMDDIVAAIKTGDKAQIEQKIDLPSFTKYYLLNEYLKTFDFERTSVYFYYKDGKLYAGPAWDYDLCAGNAYPDFSARAKNAADYNGIFADKNLYIYLAKYGWFNEMVSEVYRDHYEFIENISADGGFLDATYAQYKDVFERNYKEAGWNISKWWLNNYKKPLPTYAANYDYLKDWLDVRNDWMTVHFNPFGEDYKIGDVNGDKSIDVFDATLVQKYIVENAGLTGEQKIIADVNNDNTVDALDATEIQKYSSDMLSKFKRVI